MNNNEKFSEIASIKFGEVRFLIKQTPAAGEYFTKNLPESEMNKLMPSAGTWYSQVLGLLGLDHNKPAEVECVIYSIVSDDNQENEGDKKEIVDDKDKVEVFSEFVDSPLTIKDQDGNERKLRIKFALRKK